MTVVLVSILFLVFAGLGTIKTDDDFHSDFKFLQSSAKFVYKVHPLVLIDERGDKILLPQDELNDNSYFKLSKDQRVVLYCSGYNNLLAMHPNEKANVYEPLKNFPKTKWSKSKKFGQWYFPISEITHHARCLNPSFGGVFFNNAACANNKGISLTVHFHVGGGIIEFFTICFDRRDSMLPLYTTHQLRGSNLLFPENVSELLEFPMRHSGRDIIKVRHISGPYETDNQTRIFRNTFKGRKFLRSYLDARDKKGRIFIAAFLTPPGDFYYTPVKTGTLLYENTVPIFSSIYYGNLYRLEILGRRLALQLKLKEKGLLDVTTGIFGQLMLPDDNKELKIIYLNTEKYDNDERIKYYRPIPKYLYKIFYSSYWNLGVAFVILNNPFAEFSNKDFPCKNIMDEFTKHIGPIFGNDAVSGITICCNINDLKNVVDSIPDIKSDKGFLRFNKSGKKSLLKDLEQVREKFDDIPETDY